MLLDDLENVGFTSQQIPYAKWFAQKEQEMGKPLYEMSRSELLFILSQSENYNIVSKKIATGNQYVLWLINQGRIDFAGYLHKIKVKDVDISKEVRRCYFPDYTAVYALTQKCMVGSFVPAVAALLWLGLSISDCVNLMNGNIEIIDHSIIIRAKSQAVVSSNKLIVSVISDYLTNDQKELTARGGGSYYIPLATDGHFLKRPQFKVESQGYIPYVNDYIIREMKANGVSASSVSISGRYWRVLNEDGDTKEARSSMIPVDRWTYGVWKKVFYG